MISNTDRRKINKLLKQIEHLEIEKTRLLYISIDYDRDNSYNYKAENISLYFHEINNLKAHVERFYITKS